MPQQPFRFEAYPTVKPAQPQPQQQSLTRDELFGRQPTQPPEQVEPVRVTPTPRPRTDSPLRLGAMGIVPKASMIPRSSPKTWQQTPDPPAE
jgi:hypothetical protein